jgi:hypothetical protein
MKLMLSFLPLILILITYASFFVLSSRLVIKKALSWKLCSGYAFIALLIFVGMHFIHNATWWPLPPSLNALVGIPMNLLLGAYIFGKYGKDSNGDILGFRRGLKTTALGIVLIILFAVVTATVLYFLYPQTFQVGGHS